MFKGQQCFCCCFFERWHKWRINMPRITSPLTPPQLPNHRLFLSLWIVVSGDLMSYSVGWARPARCPPTRTFMQARALTPLHTITVVHPFYFLILIHTEAKYISRLQDWQLQGGEHHFPPGLSCYRTISGSFLLDAGRDLTDFELLNLPTCVADCYLFVTHMLIISLIPYVPVDCSNDAVNVEKGQQD